ncbi:hypothetical protein [Corynebacterium cystitidis]|uniref:hypothetical protein n=1 Tax=Corynebacterium cystitidis TaxID=35757 RepID=UPI00211F3018|nr:hypothetical protein [Corynebacterium cystitidis]
MSLSPIALSWEFVEREGNGGYWPPVVLEFADGSTDTFWGGPSGLNNGVRILGWSSISEIAGGFLPNSMGML